MPTTETQLEKYLLLLGMDGISYRKMMGEYLLYFHGALFGGIYDGRLLLKDTPRVRAVLPDAPLQLPYPGAKPMLYISKDVPAELMRQAIAITAENVRKK